MYRAVNSARMLVKDKEPGVRPLACGVIYMRLWARCCLQAGVRDMARDACGVRNSCAGLQSGIEGNVHSVRAIWPGSTGWEFDRGTEAERPSTNIFQQLLNATESDLAAADVLEAEGLMDEASESAEAEDDPGCLEFTEDLEYQPNTGFGTLLVDAKNAFNEINRYLMLWQCYYRWNKGSRFAFNCYRHTNIVYVRANPGEHPYIIQS